MILCGTFLDHILEFFHAVDSAWVILQIQHMLFLELDTPFTSISKLKAQEFEQRRNLGCRPALRRIPYGIAAQSARVRR